MWIPLICFIAIALLLVILVIINVRAQAGDKKGEVEQLPTANIETDIPSDKETMVSTEHEQISNSAGKLEIIEDSNYRAALKKFQSKKPELVQKSRKTSLSDLDYRDALRSMQKKQNE